MHVVNTGQPKIGKSHPIQHTSLAPSTQAFPVTNTHDTSRHMATFTATHSVDRSQRTSPKSNTTPLPQTTRNTPHRITQPDPSSTPAPLCGSKSHQGMTGGYRRSAINQRKTIACTLSKQSKHLIPKVRCLTKAGADRQWHQLLSLIVLLLPIQ